MKRIEFAKLMTEQENPRSMRLGKMDPLQVVTLMNREDRYVLKAVAAVRPAIAQAVRLITQAFKNGGRLFFVGAGTSGRLGVIEAAECPPTFGTPPSLIQALMAGGRSAVFKSKEGAEDSDANGEREIAQRCRRGDIVVGVAASGVTPYVRAALRRAQALGARAVLVTCHVDPTHRSVADVVIAMRTGPEILTGSTRLKAGTACKMVLNMLTTASMIQRGKVLGHWMVDLQPKSKKLVARGQRLIVRLGGVSPQRAEALFRDAGRRVNVAILMARKNLSRRDAEAALRRVDGFLERAL